MTEFEWNPETYLDEMREEIRRLVVEELRELMRR